MENNLDITIFHVEYFKIISKCQPTVWVDEKLLLVYLVHILRSKLYRISIFYLSQITWMYYSSSSMSSCLPGVSVTCDQETNVRFNVRNSDTVWNFEIKSDRMLQGKIQSSFLAANNCFLVFRSFIARCRMSWKLFNMWCYTCQNERKP